jgi:hypothetical protein
MNHRTWFADSMIMRGYSLPGEIATVCLTKDPMLYQRRQKNGPCIFSRDFITFDFKIKYYLLF